MKRIGRNPLTDPMGVPGTRAPVGVQIHFHAVFSKNVCEIIEVDAPPSENSWIRHWNRGKGVFPVPEENSNPLLLISEEN